jgi:MerR family transcriptional regulator, heat shock protein HspR
MKMKRKEGFFSISAVAKMFSVHQQTVRLYEKQGLVTPKRSAGNTRLFSEEDIDKLEEIIYLTHELGINLAGVEMIFKLKKQIGKMQKEMNKVFDSTQKELDKHAESSKQIVQQSAQRLVKIQHKSKMPIAIPDHDKEEVKKNQQSSIKFDNWEIEYETE